MGESLHHTQRMKPTSSLVPATGRNNDFSPILRGICEGVKEQSSHRHLNTIHTTGSGAAIREAAATRHLQHTSQVWHKHTQQDEHKSSDFDSPGSGAD